MAITTQKNLAFKDGFATPAFEKLKVKFFGAEKHTQTHTHKADWLFTSLKSMDVY